MRKNASGRVALAAIGAAAGTAFASGRALAGFFAQLGALSWLGVCAASAVFGALCGGCARLAIRANAPSLAALCRRALSRGASRAVGLLHGLLTAMTALAMLLTAARLGELALPVQNGAFWGMGLALAVALLMQVGRERGLPAMGAALLVFGAAFYGGLALDARAPRVNLRGEVELLLGGNLPAALGLALCHGALNACLAADAVARFSAGVSPARVGALCGAGMGLILLLGNAALLRGGALLLAQALPVVLLAARWGLFGFWLCVGFGFLCAASTLAAALAALARWLQRRC